MFVLTLLIPLFPLLAFLVIASAGRGLGANCRKVATWAIGGSFALSVVFFAAMITTGQNVSVPPYELLRSGDLTINVGLYADPLSVLLLLLVTGVSFVVHAYSSRYMIGDARHGRFFAVTSLFTFAMVLLVLSSNLLLTFTCWELMGICSYLLISHQSERNAACNAATKAFLVNAIADTGFLFALVLTYVTFGTLDIQQVLRMAPEIGDQTINLLGVFGWDCPIRTVTLLSLCFFAACMGKSAQMPLHIWLPKAMEAPTPVSALIHAATMVNAGPFLLIRLSPLLVLSQPAMWTIAIIGGATALFAAMISWTQTDVKKSLAYSTISQIGFMIMACGLGAFAAATFHLLAHGLLKAYLFLSTGSQLDQLHSHQDESDSRRRPPWTLYAGAFVIACVPPLVLFSGPYEKLWISSGVPSAGIAFRVFGLLTVYFAAVYSVRAVVSQFSIVEDSPIRPRFFSRFHLQLAAGATILVSVALIGIWCVFVPFLSSVLGSLPDGRDGPGLVGQDLSAEQEFLSGFGLLAVAIAFAVGGWTVAFAWPSQSGVFFWIPRGLRNRIYTLFLNQMYFDALYDVLLVKPFVGLSRWLWRVIDVGIFDATVTGFGRICVAAAIGIWRTVDVRGMPRTTKANDSAVASPVADESKASRKLKVSGRPLQHQLMIQLLWLIAAITFFYWLVLYP